MGDFPNEWSEFSRFSAHASRELDLPKQWISEDVRHCSIFPELTEDVSFAYCKANCRRLYSLGVLDSSELLGISRRLPNMF